MEGTPNRNSLFRGSSQYHEMLVQRAEKGNADTNVSTYGSYQLYVSDSDSERTERASISHGPSQMKEKGRKKRSLRSKYRETTSSSSESDMKVESKNSSGYSPARNEGDLKYRSVKERISPK